MDSLLGAVSAPIRGYVTGLLQTYLSKYIKDIQLEGRFYPYNSIV